MHAVYNILDKKIERGVRLSLFPGPAATSSASLCGMRSHRPPLREDTPARRPVCTQRMALHTLACASLGKSPALVIKPARASATSSAVGRAVGRSRWLAVTSNAEMKRLAHAASWARTGRFGRFLGEKPVGMFKGCYQTGVRPASWESWGAA